MHDEILAGGSADDSAAAASAEVASDDADAAAAEDLDALLADVSDEDDQPDISEVADLLAGALISGNAQASAAALEAYNALVRRPAFGGPLKAAPVEEPEEEA